MYFLTSAHYKFLFNKYLIDYLDEVDTLDDVDTELEVEALQGKESIITITDSYNGFSLLKLLCIMLTIS